MDEMPAIEVEVSRFRMGSGRQLRGGTLSMRTRKTNLTSLFAVLLLAVAMAVHAQSVDSTGAAPSFGSIATSRPINPATGTTNPSARATQTLNPYLGSTPDGTAVDKEIQLTLEDAVARGLKFNLGLIDSEQADARVRAQREHAFAELLPQISGGTEQTYKQLSRPAGGGPIQVGGFA
jgi:hypothetical protein